MRKESNLNFVKEDYVHLYQVLLDLLLSKQVFFHPLTHLMWKLAAFLNKFGNYF